MSPARFLDPDGAEYGLPTYPWGWARVFDPDLATRGQLAARGLRPGGQEPVAQLMWRSRRSQHPNRVRVALLYRISRAKPKRPLTPAKELALARALLARHRCRLCAELFPHCLPTSTGGVCPPCHDTRQQRDLEEIFDETHQEEQRTGGSDPLPQH